ncbi:capsular exopolysaccharide family [Hymenobacter roseosalivarius DSM 11622]|uniref:non-specific protein-tyrosine kinase n=1 Tax=Hymenobacter roseosalivarius DSM 11622 TaxID=645990 RepID=A0A1W1VHK1_9BACT|nr:polysaccharide biosynthesis tyrosine autokinase [Hymenobacter roseosalivarius]SMB92816.1 capsular exopolysaccharide family [Hymenobacter roseosalivarius DSM 11622]
MNKQESSDELNLSTLLFKFGRYWYLFVIIPIVLLAATWLKVQTTSPVYRFHSTLQLADRATPGSRQAQEVLTPSESRNELTSVEDEISVLTSASLVKQALDKLDFEVSYFDVTNSFVNKLGDLRVQEHYQDAGYTVKLDTIAPQVTEVPLYLELRPDGLYHIQGEADKAYLTDMRTGAVLETVDNFTLNEVVRPGQVLRTRYLTLTITPTDSIKGLPEVAKRYFVLNHPQALLGEYQGKLVVEPTERFARVLRLMSKGSVAGKETRFLNTLMETYVLNDLTDKNRKGSKTFEFIESQITKVADSLRRSEAALASFRASRGMVDVGAQSSSGIGKISELENQRAQLLTTRRTYESVLSALRTNSSEEAVSTWASAGVNDPVLDSQLSDLAQLTSQRAGLAVSANDDNPVLQALDSRIQSRRQSLQRSLTGLIRSSDATLADISTRLGTIKTAINQMPENQRQEARLRTQTTLNDQNYNFLMQKRTEAALMLATNVSDKKIVDHAQQSDSAPESPKGKQLYMFAVLAGLMLPAGFLLLRDRTAQTVQSADELKRVTNAPFLGLIADAGRKIRLARMEMPRSAVTESFRTVRVNLQYVAAGPDRRVIGFTSSTSGEGKTFCCTNLAAELALSGRRTILIETDMRKPTVAGYFGFDSRHAGLSSYLNGECTLAEAIQQPDIPNLTILAAGPIPENALELLEMPRMATLIAELRKSYDYVIVDAPPLGLVSEYYILNQYTDVTIFVVRHRYTQRNMLSQVQELAQRQTGNQQVYVLLNGVNFSSTYEYRYKGESAYYTA